MIEINITENKIVEEIKNGYYTSNEISKRIGVTVNTVRYYLALMADYGLLRRHRHYYDLRQNVPYTVVKLKIRANMTFLADIKIDSSMSEIQKKILIENYGKMSRTELAKKVGMKKLEMNQAIYELKIGEDQYRST